jgi:hypothetical protein
MFKEKKKKKKMGIRNMKRVIKLSSGTKYVAKTTLSPS